MGKIPIAECTPGRVYQIQSRNLTFGVYDGNEGFIGIREKFGHRYLFTEYHWDQGPPYGTVSGQKDLGIDLPADISPKESLGTVDKETRRASFSTALYLKAAGDGSFVIRTKHQRKFGRWRCQTSLYLSSWSGWRKSITDHRAFRGGLIPKASLWPASEPPWCG